MDIALLDVMLVAAAAGIAFAAEVSAGVRLTTNVFGYDKTNGASALTIKHENEFYHAPIAFSVSGEQAGGTLKLTDHSGDGVVSGKWNIWFAPIDQLKVNVGVWTNTMNQEHIDWYRSSSGIGIDDNANLAVTITPIDGLSIDAVFSPGSFGGSWFKDKRTIAIEALAKDGVKNPKDKAKEEFDKQFPDAPAGAFDALWAEVGDAAMDAYNDQIDAWIDAWEPVAKIGQLGFMMHYGADFGTISAVFNYNQGALKLGHPAKAASTTYGWKDHDDDPSTAPQWLATGTTAAVAAKATYKEADSLKFGAGYSGSVDPLSFFVNVLGFTAPKWDDKEKMAFDKIRVEAYAETTIDALSAKFWVPFEFKTNLYDDAKAKDKINLGALVRLDYAVGDYTLYLQAGNDSDYIVDTGKDFSMQIKPGVKFNVGECAIDAAIDVNATKNFSFSVPVSFQVNF